LVNVLFVCLGNICRSPLAEGIFRHYVDAAGLGDGPDGIFIDSAGTLGFHAGAAPDPRSILVAGKKGIDISGLICRRISTADFEDFDYILAMDNDNLAYLKEICPADTAHRLHLLLPFARDLKGLKEIPDPYLYRSMEAYERVYDFIDRAAKGLLDEIIRRHFSGMLESDAGVAL
jgi:protein-tyrosine phosphatase